MREEYFDLLDNLLNPEQTSDEELAEFFVAMNMLWKEKDERGISADDMNDFNEKEFCKELEKFLGETIHSPEICQSAWWKGKSEEYMLATEIVEEFEMFLEEKDITIPSEDREGNPEEARIYGCDYYDLVDAITSMLLMSKREEVS